MKITPHTTACGAIVNADAQEEITSLSSAFLLDKLARHGYLVLRGFKVDIGGFSRLVRQTSARITVDPARSFNGDTAQKVDAGTAPVGLHCENGNSPFWPDLCWFYCEKEPKRGSQTTVCDGLSVYNDLDEDARATITAQDIVYSRRVEAKHWKALVFHMYNGQADAPEHPDDVTINQLLKLVNGDPATHVAENPDGSINYSFRTPAVRRSAIAGDSRLSFANSIFGPSYNYETPSISFADGTPLTAELLACLDAACDRHTYDVGWRTNDVVLIDNTRVMHGRRKIEDTDRVIYNALSYSA